MSYFKDSKDILLNIKGYSIATDAKSPLSKTNISNTLCELERIFLRNTKTEFLVDPLLGSPLELLKLAKCRFTKSNFHKS